LILQLELAAILIDRVLLKRDNASVLAGLSDYMGFHHSSCCLGQQLSGLLGWSFFLVRLSIGWCLDTLSRRWLSNHSNLPNLLLRPKDLRWGSSSPKAQGTNLVARSMPRDDGTPALT
jgi:hypothetical protein